MFKIGDKVKSINRKIRGEVFNVMGTDHDNQRVWITRTDGVISVFWAVDLCIDESEAVLYDYTNSRVARKDR